jgi:uncharacterized delta-60 repeat protein/uncharacterized repeat protein (TIGR01451 family)
MKKHLSARLIVSRLAQAICLHFLFLFITSNLLAQTGVLDVTFGNKGKVITHASVGNGEDDITSIAIQPDGKLVAVGGAWNGSTVAMTIVRYNGNGSLDSSFGTSGKTYTVVNTYSDQFSSVVVQPDGKILAAGTTFIPGSIPENSDVVVARYNSNGTLDSSFGNKGIVITDFYGGLDNGNVLLLKSDGRILVGGEVVKNVKPYQGVPADGFGLVEYKANGTLDSTFGLNGKLYTAVSLSLESTGALQADSRIVVGGSSLDSKGNTNFTLIRYNENGSIDSSFAASGIVTTDFANGDDDVNSLAIHKDNKILVTGTVFNGSKKSIGIARYNTNGSLDVSFGSGGKVITTLSANEDNGHSIQVQPDGKIIVAGGANLTYPNSTGDFALLRYATDGRLDSSFGKHGVITTDFLGSRDEAFASAIQPDGKIVLAGTASLGYRSNDFALARYESNAYLYYNTIKGSVFIDKNANNIKDSNEPFYNNASIIITKAGIDTIKLVAANGKFATDVDTGSYVTNVAPYSSYYNIVPATYNSAHSTYFNSDSVSFAMQPIPGKRDLAVSIIPLQVARPGFAVTYKIAYQNNGTDTAYAANVKLIATYGKAGVANDTIVWNVAQLNPQDTSSKMVTLKIPAQPSLNIGDTIRLAATITSSLADLTPNDNTAVLTQRLMGSFDPNDKLESHAGTLTLQQVANADYLTYTIRFQNTGTDTAFNVYIRDTLSNKVDWGTLQVLSSSHNYQLTINDGNNLSFAFNNINLVDSNHNEPASHAYITYRVKSITTLLPADTIKNSASIYFDYNLPVATNTEKTVVQAMVLPLKLLSFAVKRVTTGNLLQWSTSQEINTSSYEIERGANGIDYDAIGKVNANAAGTYAYTDDKAAKAVNYYRLKLVDKDGSYTNSVVRIVNNSGSFNVSVFPNPVGNTLSLAIKSDNKASLKVQIVDMQGKIVLAKQLTAEASSSTVSFDVASLKGGSYFVKVASSGTEQWLLKFEKL